MNRAVHRRPRLVAHRGLHDETRGGSRENTLEAVQDAVDAGAEMVEIDVQLSREGAVVVLHDSTLERLWGDRRAVTEIELDELRTIGTGDRRIPLLAQVLEVIRGTGTTLLIDIDHLQPAAPAAEVVLTAQRPVSQGAVQTAWCGDAGAMRVIQQKAPGAEVWTPWYQSTPPAAADLERGSRVVNIRHLLVSRDFVEAVHSLGATVACWTVDEPTRAAHLAEIGVDSITTNRLPQLRKALEGARA